MIPTLLALPVRVAVALGAVALTAAPQFRASVDVVRIEALVLDGDARSAGLSAADFAVTDNGVPQTIAVRALARQAIDVAIALDTSGSVRGERLDRLRRRRARSSASSTSQDRATLVTFDHHVTLGPRDGSPAALDARLSALAAGGRTALVDAVTAALVWSGGRERPMLILVVQRRTRHVELDACRAGHRAGPDPAMPSSMRSSPASSWPPARRRSGAAPC